MRDFLRTMFLLLLCVLFAAIVAQVLLGSGRNRAGQPTPLEVIAQPEAAARISADNNRSREKLAEVAAADALAARAETTRRLIVGAGVFCVLILAAAIVMLSVTLLRATRSASRYWPEEPMRVLYPGDPEFELYLRDRGGLRINGVPRLNGKAVTYIDVTPDKK